MKKRFTEEQIVGFLKEAEGGVGVKDLCRRHGFSEGSYYVWRSKYGGLEVTDVKRLSVYDGRKTDLPSMRYQTIRSYYDVIETR